MKKLTLALIFLAGVYTQHAEAQTAGTGSDKGLDLSLMDKSVRPQDDFYNYVSGTWMKTAKIPSDKPTWGSFNKLAEDTDNNSMKILNSLLKDKFPEGSEGKKIQDLYASYMNLQKRNADGIKPIQGNLNKIDAIKNLKDLQNYLTSVTKEGENNFYGWGVYADLKDSKMNAVYLGDASLGLGRDYYQKENEKNTEAIAEYQKYVASMLTELGYKNADAAAKGIVDYEKSIAKTYLTNEQSRDNTLQYNPQTMAELTALVKNVNLPEYLKKVGVNTEKVIIGELGYYKNFDKLVSAQNLPVIKDYLKFHMINGSASYLSEKLGDMRFAFYGKYLRGQQEQRALNKRGFELINSTLGEAFGKLYVEKYFPAEAKAQMVELIDYLKKSFAVHINDLSWMSSATKGKALEKLNKFTVKVAYPDKWKDYSKLNILSENKGGNLYANLQNITTWRYEKDLAKIGKAVDKSEWGMTPQTVNAYYNPVNNEIVFPAAILQPPFFNPQADAAVNFGGIGAVIGHEMSHGFDDSGAQFDADGNLVDWWTPEDKANFEKATKTLAAQYDKYEPVKGTFVNGTFTNGENIADLGGVNIAYDALQLYLKDKGNPGEISGYTQDQRFFLSWATVWRTLSSEKYMVNQVKTDPHSPGYFRSFGPLINVDAFYKAFDVKQGDKLYKSPEERIKIW
ncbi:MULTISPECIES: M13 family metallopeptidase [Sphingobacterium]|uniref:M13 family metallopeptidase n=3 Tax=Sphingobacterium TaxID=28453 RepID=A0ABX7CT05_SPHMU|nr:MULTISPECIES: M13 family metallopeptidase [Sphingobacterium]MBB1646603.1 endothelin-converting protein [Sphingobacterium sp. UME9]MCS4164024.1 putative endopeptidase [Sphingobacterium sp. BIGb0116]QMV66142.1 M13 family metallopeptidase [Sphingobacterium paramultivorum]QQT29553.1 M13 family metallopeptidase [Sphingobacterium multivorum]QQT54428.1 M13 family metallopeptidase [Sphingobacterium multivorum]